MTNLRRHWQGYLLISVISFAIGLGLSETKQGDGLKLQVTGGLQAVKSKGLEKFVSFSDQLGTRELLLLEYPEMIGAIKGGAAFGGAFSRIITLDIFGRTEKAMAEAKRLSRIVEVAPRTWMIYLPVVNAVLFETDEGLVLVDTGMAAAGPTVLELIRSVSSAPIHTIIYTHGHVDHAFGSWALLEDNPEIVAHENIGPRFERYLRLRGSLAKYMSQPLESLPATQDDFVYPTKTIGEATTLTIGGEAFHLRPHRGETDDQLYVWVPSRKAIASADFYQGFIPNVGNGKRVQRFPEDWAKALREMAAEDVELLLPAHNKAISDPVLIKESLTTLADYLQTIVDQTIAELNKGTAKGEIPHSIRIPPALAQHPTLNEQYVSARDISKMVIKNYTGWWDDIPSHWSPETFSAQGQEIVSLAGGVENLDRRARELSATNLALASHLVDWAWAAEPDNPLVQQLVIDIYRLRILDDKSNTMEQLTYLDAMIAARNAQMTAP